MKSCLFFAGFIAVSLCSDAQIKLLTADAKYENVRVALEEKYSSYNRVMITKVLITPKLYLNSNEHYTNQGKDGLNIPIAQLNKSGTQLLYSHAETPDLKNSDALEFLSWILEEGQPILANTATIHSTQIRLSSSAGILRVLKKLFRPHRAMASVP